jgi:SAM-dependent methyltransferase
MKRRETIQDIIQQYHTAGDYQGWFEALYAAAEGDPDIVPWAKLVPHPHFTRWADQQRLRGDGQRALVVGCGLGDDAEDLAKRGFDVTAFDLSESAIGWCRKRFPESDVAYHVADLFKPPSEWVSAFDFVLEINTIQAMPPEMRAGAIAQVAKLIVPGGLLLLVARGREEHEMLFGPPWPLSESEVRLFEGQGFQAETFETFENQAGVKRFRAAYRRSS